MQGLGCALIAVFVILTYFVSTVFKLPGDASFMIVLFVIAVLVIVLVAKSSKTRDKKNLQNLQDTVDQLQAWIANPTVDTPNFLSEKGEKTLFELANIDLMEYVSAGSTYESVHGGVIFPIVGRVSGIGGVSKGESTKKPEQLTPVDKGKVLITDKQVVFVGDKQTREWPFDKMLDVQAGPNGLWVKLASSAQKKNAFLQHLGHDQMPIGAAIGIATSWVTGSEKTAKEYATNLIAQFNQTIAEHTPASKKKA